MARPGLRNHPKFRWELVYPVLSRIEHAPGCYAIYVAGELVYIGQSVNLHLRFRRWGFCKRSGAFYESPWGRVPAGQFKVKVAYSLRVGDWAMREVRLVRRLRPKFNSIKYAGKESARG